MRHDIDLAGKLHLRNAAVGKAISADGLQIFAETNRLQRGIAQTRAAYLFSRVRKDIRPQVGDTVAENQRLQLSVLADIERIRHRQAVRCASRHQAGVAIAGDGERLQARAALEHSRAKAGDGGRNLQFRQARAAVEGAIADASHRGKRGIRQAEFHLLEINAPAEGARADLRDRRTDIDGFQARIVVKCVGGYFAGKDGDGLEPIAAGQDEAVHHRGAQLVDGHREGQLLHSASLENIAAVHACHGRQRHLGELREAVIAVGEHLVAQLGDKAAHAERLQAAACADEHLLRAERGARRVDRQLGQRGAALNESVPDAFDRIRYEQLFQRSTAFEGVAADRRHARAQLDLRDAGAVCKGAAADIAVQTHAFERRAATKRPSGNRFDAADRQVYALQRRAVEGKAVRDGAHTRSAHVDQLQIRAASECVCTHGQKAAGQLHGAKGRIAGKCVCGNPRNPIGGSIIFGDEAGDDDILLRPRIAGNGNAVIAIVVGGVAQPRRGRGAGNAVILRADVNIADILCHHLIVGHPFGVVMQLARAVHGQLDRIRCRIALIIDPAGKVIARQRRNVRRQRNRIAAAGVKNLRHFHPRMEEQRHVLVRHRAEADRIILAPVILNRIRIGGRKLPIVVFLAVIHGRKVIPAAHTNPALDLRAVLAGRRQANRFVTGNKPIAILQGDICIVLGSFENIRIRHTFKVASVRVIQLHCRHRLGIGIEGAILDNVMRPFFDHQLLIHAAVQAPAEQLVPQLLDIGRFRLVKIRFRRHRIVIIADSIPVVGQHDLDGLHVIRAAPVRMELLFVLAECVIITILVRPVRIVRIIRLAAHLIVQQVNMQREHVHFQHRRLGRRQRDRPHARFHLQLHDEIEGDGDAVEHVDIGILIQIDAVLSSAMGVYDHGQQAQIAHFIRVVGYLLFYLILGIDAQACKRFDGKYLAAQHIHFHADFAADFRLCLQRACHGLGGRFRLLGDHAAFLPGGAGDGGIIKGHRCFAAEFNLYPRRKGDIDDARPAENDAAGQRCFQLLLIPGRAPHIRVFIIVGVLAQLV